MGVSHPGRIFLAVGTLCSKALRSKTTGLVEEITGSNLSAAQKLVETYTNIIQSDTVLNRVVENAGLDRAVGGHNAHFFDTVGL